MLQQGDPTTEDYIFCSTIECTNKSWPFNGTYDETWNLEVYCNNEYQSENFSDSTVFHTIVCIMYGIIFIFALFGNGLVCVIQKTLRVKTVTNYFIANLAMGDILLTIFCIPFTFVPMLIIRYWPFGAAMCKIVNYSQAVSVFVSSYTYLAISIDRYMAITRPLKPRLGKTAAKIVVAAVWFGAVCTAAPILIMSKLLRPSQWHKICKTDICTEYWVNPIQRQQYTSALLALQFVLPLGVLVFTYARIAYIVWRVRPPGEAQSDRDLRMQSSKRKMIKMMVTVVAVFTVCWLPLNIFLILWDVYSEDNSWSSWPGMPYVWFVCHWLAMSHCCYNPIIYCYMNSRYRRGFQQVLDNLMCRRVKQTSYECNNMHMCEGHRIPLAEIGKIIGDQRPKSASTGQLDIDKCYRCSSLMLERTQKDSNSLVQSFSLKSHSV